MINKINYNKQYNKKNYKSKIVYFKLNEIDKVNDYLKKNNISLHSLIIKVIEGK